MINGTPQSHRTIICQNYALMDNPNQHVTCSRSASLNLENHHPICERSPTPSTSIAPFESASNISNQIPDITKKTWGRKLQTGAQQRWNCCYKHFENINLDKVYYKKEDKA
jgi:hypothetical protein